MAQAINKIERKGREAYIKQEYALGECCEFDWGTVKLYTDNNILREYQMAVFTTAHGNYRYARLFPKQNTSCFLESHALFFEKIQGVYKNMVYDNMKVAVKKFLGRNEKEPTEALLKLSLYYAFNFRFCNAYSGNEKGHVERSVDYIRRKAFSNKDNFQSLEQANAYLEKICDELNNKAQPSYNNKTAYQLFNEEKEYLLPSMPMYETAEVVDLRVDKYSTITVDTCHYSVSDKYVNCLVRTKKYSNKIICYYENEKIAEHTRKYGFNEWVFKIEHYLNTLTKKPGALVHSVAIKQMDSKLIDIYNKYYIQKEKEFIDLLKFIGKNSLEKVEEAIGTLIKINPYDITTEKIKFICNKTVIENGYNDSLKDKSSEILKASTQMLEVYTTMLLACNKPANKEVIHG